jgi:hypothetical protein
MDIKIRSGEWGFGKYICDYEVPTKEELNNYLQTLVDITDKKILLPLRPV